MREILFRGKTYDGEWVYGGYFEGRGCHFILLPGAAFVEVRQETVGQFTGRFDNNGKKIFEGDIVSFHKVLGHQGLIKPFEGVVKYGRGYYYVEYINERNQEGKLSLSSCWYLTVVGNIHEEE